MAWLTTPKAAEKAQVSYSTMLFWLTRDPDLGRKIAGRWRVDSERLREIIDGVTTPFRSR